MHASDVMTTNTIYIHTDTPVPDIAQLLLEKRISAVPVVDQEMKILGIVSEGDLMRRPENETESRHSWWLEAIFSTRDWARDYIKTHGRTADDVMTRQVIVVSEDTPLHEIAQILEKHHIKRVPVVRNERLVGIVSRANLLHGLVTKEPKTVSGNDPDDKEIRRQLLKTLSEETGLTTALINVTVKDGAVQLWGTVNNATDRKAAQLAAENTPGVKSVENNLKQITVWVSPI